MHFQVACFEANVYRSGYSRRDNHRRFKIANFFAPRGVFNLSPRIVMYFVGDDLHIRESRWGMGGGGREIENFVYRLERDDDDVDLFV